MSGDNKGFIRRWWRRLRIALIIFGALLLLLLGTRLFLLYRVHSAISAIRDRGVPTTSSELAAMYGPAAGQDAEDSFAAAFAALDVTGRSFDLARSLPPSSVDPLPAETKWEFASHLARNEKALSLVEKALEKGDCRLRVDLRPRAADRSDALRHVATLFHMRAQMAVDQRQPDAAVRAILTQFALARSLGNEARASHLQLRNEIVHNAVRDIEFALNARILDARHLGPLDKTVRDEETHDGLLRAVQGERCTRIDLILEVGEFGPVIPFKYPGESIERWWLRFVDTVRERFQLSIYLIRMRGEYGFRDAFAEAREAVLGPSCDYLGFLQADYLHYLRLLGRMEEIALKPYPARMVAFKEEVDKRDTTDYPNSSFHRFCRYANTGSLLVSSSAGVTTLLRCARVAIAAERYRMALGKWPDQLADLTPAHLSEVPQSPFTGLPLIYRQRDGNFRVYSPGACMKDRGGHHTCSGFTGDIAFSLYAPADPTPLAKCVVRSRKTIMTRASGLCIGGGEMALSPTGRHLVMLKQLNAKSASGEYLYQRVVLDVASGEVTELQVKPIDVSGMAISPLMDNVISAKGNYIHVFATRLDDTDRSILLYDVNTRKSRRFDAPDAASVASDTDETQLWIDESIPDGTRGSPKGTGPKPYRLHTFPLGEGKEEHIILPGAVFSISPRDLTTVISETDDWSEILLMDLTRGTTIAALPADIGQNVSPAPFWAPGNRFLCHDMGTRFWDRSRDRVFSLPQRAAIAPGPGPNTVYTVEESHYGPWKALRLVDLATGQEWDPIAQDDGDCVCAVGKCLVCAKADRDGSISLTLIEIGLEERP